MDLASTVAEHITALNFLSDGRIIFAADVYDSYHERDTYMSALNSDGSNDTTLFTKNLYPRKGTFSSEIYLPSKQLIVVGNKFWYRSGADLFQFNWNGMQEYEAFFIFHLGLNQTHLGSLVRGTGGGLISGGLKSNMENEAVLFKIKTVTSPVVMPTTPWAYTQRSSANLLMPSSTQCENRGLFQLKENRYMNVCVGTNFNISGIYDSVD